MKEFITACPRNCYSTCSFRVQVENNRIVKILPYSFNRATPEGPCIKGLSYIERANSADRITKPLLKKNGEYQIVTSDEALNYIASKLDNIKREHGPQSILWYRGSGMSGLTNEIGSAFWKAFGGATTTYGNLCWPAGLEAVRLTLGSVKHNVPWDLKNAHTIIIWGKNPAETNIQEIAFIADARKNGCRVIVIDPLRTPTADKADVLISPLPGTDAALALAIAKILVENEMTDQIFIQKYVKGFDEFRKSLDITPEKAEEITGIPAGDIIELAGIIGLGGTLTIIPGYGLQRHFNGGQTIRSILSLIVITGNIGKPGSGFNYANLQGYIFDDIKEPESYYPDPEKDTPFRRTISMTKLGKDMLNASGPPIKAAWVERGNPLIQSPDSLNVRKAFSKLIFRVVVEQFMTDTAETADVILPAKNMFEQSDIIGSYWSPYVQFKPKTLDPPDDVMPESEVYYHLSQKLGFKISPEELPEPGNENIEKWLEKRISGYSCLSLNDLKNGPVLAPGLQEIAFSDLKFDTPSGKIELMSSEAEKRWNVSSLPDYIPLKNKELVSSYPLKFLTPNTGSRIHSQFGNLKIIRETVQSPATEISLHDAKERGISTGQKIRIFNQKGEIESTARVSKRIPRGIAVLPNGLWMNEGGGDNLLIEPMETDMGFGAAFHDNYVEIEGLKNDPVHI
jgi:anaerobic selenocysteine-containing dehydrogenase